MEDYVIQETQTLITPPIAASHGGSVNGNLVRASD